jgi:hypothetical protein
MLGQRYGWIAPDGAEQLARLRDDLARFADRSITELEIRHGALDPSPGGRDAVACLFLLRTPRLSRELHAKAPPQSENAAASEIEHTKLAALKGEIRERFPSATFEYDTLPEFEGLITGYASSVHHASVAQSPHAGTDVADHVSAGRRRALMAIPRPRLERRLRRRLTSLTPVAVQSSDGRGASTLVSAYVSRRAEEGQERLLYRDCETAGGFSGWQDLVASLASEIHSIVAPKRDGQLPLEKVLGLLDERSRWLVVFDNLDGLFEGEDDIFVDWVPLQTPRHVRLCVTARNPRLAQQLTARGLRTLRLPRLGPFERLRMMRAMLGRFQKKLSWSQTFMLATSPIASTPGTLRLAIDHLRRAARYATLEADVERVSMCRGAPELTRVLLEDILDASRLDVADLPNRVLELLLRSRRGLNEPEIRRTLTADTPQVRPFEWAATLATFRPVTIDRDGLIDLTSLDLRQRLLETIQNPPASTRRMPDRDERGIRVKLAAAFRDAPLARRIEERPWQLAGLGAWQELADELRDPVLFSAMCAQLGRDRSGVGRGSGF